MNTIAEVATAVLLLFACWSDIRRMEISNILCAAFAAGGFLFQLAAYGPGRIWWTIGGFAAGAIPFFLLYAVRGLGAGDVKWFAAYGVWAGAAATLELAVYSLLFAGGIAALLLMLKLPVLRNWALRLDWPWGAHPVRAGKGAKFPFMLAVAPAYALLALNVG
ncbi:A24 family peptidase [Cohnella rhizosphaerae]|uniref:Prepilin peptidase n=1 Tax=Cohnella rhizosphaerae TaxID=1457232 RepID=A0A9X4KNT8_9BACL|nr:prepilin peptidase [Cohnella rhizosphaerae]MDG0808339.1 prepilin peptidase [Cohnella rhizosphaerae]